MKVHVVAVSLALVMTGAFGSQALAADPTPAKPGENGKVPDETGARPWAKGVSKADQEAAFALFAEGTRLLKDAFFTRAADRYRAAIAKWDHPAIHFNLAKALMNLDTPAEAYKHFDSSLKYGGEPLDPDQIEQAKHYKKDLYENELAEVTVTATEPDAIVTLNNSILFTAPGSWTGVVRPGQAAIIASKTGFETVQLQPKLKVGTKTDIPIEMIPTVRNVVYKRAFPNWIPWTVFSTGLVVIGGGGLSTWQASKAYKDFDNAIATCDANSTTPIAGTDGEIHACFPTKSITDKRDRGDLFSTLSTVGYIAGGAIAATGIVLLIVNREKPVDTEGTVAPVLGLVPYVGPDGAGVSATLGF